MCSLTVEQFDFFPAATVAFKTFNTRNRSKLAIGEAAMKRVNNDSQIDSKIPDARMAALEQPLSIAPLQRNGISHGVAESVQTVAFSTK